MGKIMPHILDDKEDANLNCDGRERREGYISAHAKVGGERVK